MLIARQSSFPRPRRVPLNIARLPFPCPLQPDRQGGRITSMMHGLELNEIQSPDALADSPFVVSRWWSIREGARRLLSRLHAS
jgi:hypothetical protein